MGQCWQNYVDYHKCVNAKGEEFAPCKQFQHAFRSLCPGSWVERWDGQRGTSIPSPPPPSTPCATEVPGELRQVRYCEGKSRVLIMGCEIHRGRQLPSEARLEDFHSWLYNREMRSLAGMTTPVAGCAQRRLGVDCEYCNSAKITVGIETILPMQM